MHSCSLFAIALLLAACSAKPAEKAAPAATPAAPAHAAPAAPAASTPATPAAPAPASEAAFDFDFKVAKGAVKIDGAPTEEHPVAYRSGEAGVLLTYKAGGETKEQEIDKFEGDSQGAFEMGDKLAKNAAGELNIDGSLGNTDDEKAFVKAVAEKRPATAQASAGVVYSATRATFNFYVYYLVPAGEHHYKVTRQDWVMADKAEMNEEKVIKEINL